MYLSLSNPFQMYYQNEIKAFMTCHLQIYKKGQNRFALQFVTQETPKCESLFT